MCCDDRCHTLLQQLEARRNAALVAHEQQTPVLAGLPRRFFSRRDFRSVGNAAAQNHVSLELGVGQGVAARHHLADVCVEGAFGLVVLDEAEVVVLGVVFG